MNHFVFLCTIFWIFYLTEAQVAKCVYKYDYHWTESYKTTNASYYGCGLDTRQANYDEKLTRIYGQHLSGHSDADVTYMGNYIYNKLKIFSSIFCQKFPNLEVFRINDAEMESIDEDSVSNFKNLDKLFLDGNKIRELPENLLIENSKLTYFWIRNNQLTTLPENLFQNQKELEDLELENNQINFLPSNIFRPLVKLEVLKMFNNKLQSINPEWFVTLQNLKWLGLSGNQILEIPSKCFSSLGKLERLFLYDNEIKTLKSDNFDGLQNLQILNLRNNEISDLPVGVFTQLKNLQLLSLENNKLTTIHSDSFGIHNQLTTIWLNDNKINSIYPNFLDNKKLTTFYTRNNICCKEDADYSSEFKSILKTCFDNYQPRLSQPQQQVRQQSTTSSQDICGKSSTGQGNIVGGSQISRGSFPWLAALVNPSGKFFCGGTLVSNKKVLTAAHCIQEKHQDKATKAGEMAVLLGAYDLNKTIEIGRFPYAVETVNVHPDWNTLSEPYDYDIAVLVLDSQVTFTKFIQPICMPNSYIVSIKTGTVVGFGKSEDTTKVHENIPKMIETPIHSNEECFLKYYLLAKLSSKRTFCGGTGTGIGVCRGDSGGGLIVTDGSTFYIRGIVSSSLIGGPYGCDLNVYSVFTDVTKYVDWINRVSTDRFSK